MLGAFVTLSLFLIILAAQAWFLASLVRETDHATIDHHRQQTSGPPTKWAATTPSPSPMSPGLEPDEGACEPAGRLTA